jgi:uncharacterized protein (DUF2336 family)
MASTPYQKLLELAYQRALDGKGGLAASVAEMCLASKMNLSERELELAFEILRLLVDKVEVRIRRHIADYLTERADVPRDLVQFLASDEITVAYPIILHSTLLHDEDLLDIIVNRTKQHRQAIAIRPNISPRVTECLMEQDDPGIMTTLLCNETAEISETAMRKMVDRSIEFDTLREPLIHRREMTSDLAQKMYVWVGDSLRDYILANYQVDPNAIAESVDHALSTDFSDDPRPDATPSAPTEQDIAAEIISSSPAHRTGEFADGYSLLHYLNLGDMPGFESAFASHLNLPLEAMSLILHESGMETLAIACKASGMEREVFCEIICHLSGSRPAEAFRVTEDFTKAIVYFDQIDHTAAAAVLNRWRNSPSQRWSA